MKSNTVDLNSHVNLNINSLKLLGLWFFMPYSKKSYKFWLCSIIKVVYCLVVFVIPNSGQAAYLVKLIISGNATVTDVASILDLIFAEFYCLTKMLDMYFNRHSLMIVVKELNCKEFQTTDPDFVKILNGGIALSRKMYIIFLSSAMADIFVHTVVVPIMHKFSTTPVKMDLVFFDVNDKRFFKYVCAYQILYKAIMVAAYASVQCLCWSCLKCAICQLEVLSKKIANIDKYMKDLKVSTGCDEHEAFRIVFYDCFCHYRAIKRYTKAVQSAFGGQLTLTLFLTACIIGNTALQLFSIESPLKNKTEILWTLAFIVIMTSNLFVDCYFGNDVMYKSAAISTIVFGCPWISQPKELKRNVAIFIALTQQPIKLTAAKLIPVSSATFTTEGILNCLGVVLFFLCIEGDKDRLK